MWVPPDRRDGVMDFVTCWSSKTAIAAARFVSWLGISRSKYYSWQSRYGQANEHNGWVVRDHWLEAWEKKAIIDFHGEHPLEGYRLLAFMMLDRDIVAVSPSSLYRVLKEAGLLRKWTGQPSGKGKGFKQPLHPHQHWHVDIAYVNICGTFYYLGSVLDGYSRYVVHWDIRPSMTEADVEVILQRARENFPGRSPRVISDNGPQFIAKDFKAFIRICGMTHVRTAPYYPQSNGKIERWHKTLKSRCLRPKTPLSLEDAKRLVTEFVEYYNTVRLHSALGYITPKDKLEGNEQTIFQERDRKLEDARERRKLKRRIESRQNRPDNGSENSKINSGHFVPNQLTYAQQYSNSG